MTRSTVVEPKQRTEGRKRFFHYMFITALEGGIGYWSEVDIYHWHIKDDPSVAGSLADDIDNFYASIVSNVGDWGVEAAYQPGTNPMLVHKIFAANSEMKAISGDTSLRIDIDVIERGWNLFMNKVLAAVRSEDHKAPFSRKYFRQAIIQYLTDMEEGDSDADVADLVVQLGLFGEHVYA
jgi:hypothetical protein